MTLLTRDSVCKYRQRFPVSVQLVMCGFSLSIYSPRYCSIEMMSCVSGGLKPYVAPFMEISSHFIVN